MFTKTELKQLREMRGQLEQIESDASEIIATAQGRYDDRSDKWKEGETGEAAATDLSNGDDTITNLQNAIESLNTIEGMNE